MHISGSKMVQSDALSRQPDHIPDEDTDNEDLVLLPEKLFINLVNVKLAKMIESATTSDELVKNMTNILFTKGQEIHELPMTRHSGRDTTLEMVQRHYWWPRLHHFVYE